MSAEVTVRHRRHAMKDGHREIRTVIDGALVCSPFGADQLHEGASVIFIRRRLGPEGQRYRAGCACVKSRTEGRRQRDLTTWPRCDKYTVFLATILVEIGALPEVRSKADHSCSVLQLCLLSEK